MFLRVMQYEQEIGQGQILSQRNQDFLNIYLVMTL